MNSFFSNSLHTLTSISVKSSLQSLFSWQVRSKYVINCNKIRYRNSSSALLLLMLSAHVEQK